MYIYIHGFNSSSKSHKAQLLKSWLRQQGRESEWFCPDLPHFPLEAIRLLSELIESVPLHVERPKLVGSSLGGFYANVLAYRYELKTIVINPAVHPATLLKSALGTQKLWNSTETYELTQTHLDEWQELECSVESAQKDISENIFLLQERGDEVLDWKLAVDYFKNCNQLVFVGGNHSFTRYKDVLELIDRF